MGNSGSSTQTHFDETFIRRLRKCHISTAENAPCDANKGGSPTRANGLVRKRKDSLEQSVKRQRTFPLLRDISPTNIALEPSASEMELNAIQISLLKKSWSSARSKGVTEPGLTILQHCFFRAPDMREVFTGGDGKQANYHQKLREHALMVNELFDNVIGSLSNENACEEKLLEIGRQHANLRARGFKVTHWDVFANIALEQMSGSGVSPGAVRRKRETQLGWIRITMFVIGRLKDGFYAEIRRLRKLSPSPYVSQDSMGDMVGHSRRTSASASGSAKGSSPASSPSRPRLHSETVPAQVTAAQTLFTKQKSCDERRSTSYRDQEEKGHTLPNQKASFSEPGTRQASTDSHGGHDRAKAPASSGRKFNPGRGNSLEVPDSNLAFYSTQNMNVSTPGLERIADSYNESYELSYGYVNLDAGGSAAAERRRRSLSPRKLDWQSFDTSSYKHASSSRSDQSRQIAYGGTTATGSRPQPRMEQFLSLDIPNNDSLHSLPTLPDEFGLHHQSFCDAAGVRLRLQPATPSETGPRAERQPEPRSYLAPGNNVSPGKQGEDRAQWDERRSRFRQQFSMDYGNTT